MVEIIYDSRHNPEYKENINTIGESILGMVASILQKRSLALQLRLNNVDLGF